MKNFFNEIANEEKNVCSEVFIDYYRYYNPSFLTKDLFKAKKVKTEKIKSCANDLLI